MLQTAFSLIDYHLRHPHPVSTHKILEEIIDNYLEHFYKTAQSSSICDFYNNLENSIYHVELRKALSLIHEHKYQGALDYLKDKGEGIFKNGDVSINNAIREYCINQLS